jgi:hypothetical protein
VALSAYSVDFENIFLKRFKAGFIPVELTGGFVYLRLNIFWQIFITPWKLQRLFRERQNFFIIHIIANSID